MSAEAETAFSYKRWYYENRLALNEKRRKRYAEDPEFRTKARDWVRKNRAKKRKKKVVKKRASKREGQVKKPHGKRGLPKPKIVQLEGKFVELYSFGTLCRATGLSKATLHKWEKLGIVPPGCCVVDQIGGRWFSGAFIKFMQRIAVLRESFPRAGRARVPILGLFAKVVRAEWNKAKRSIPDLSKVSV